jgi:hypothetical protein
MIVAGGVYVETCATPPSRTLMGSAGRAAVALLGRETVELHTFHPPDLFKDVLVNFVPLGIEVRLHASGARVEFEYLYPLSRPRISPVPLPASGSVAVTGRSVLRFGCLEGNFVVDAATAVFDPQSGAAPDRFRANGSRAERLALVLNALEARLLSARSDLATAAADLMRTEGASVVVVKDGPAGAHVFEADRVARHVPAFDARGANKVGSGDVFSAMFAHLWHRGEASAVEAAHEASRHAAHYVSTRVLPCPDALPPAAPRAMRPDPRILVLADADTTASAWLVGEALDGLRQLGAHAAHFRTDSDPSHAGSVEAIRWDDWDVVVALVTSREDGALRAAAIAVGRGKRVVALAERAGTADAAREAGCDVSGDLASLLYGSTWAVA